MTTPPVTPIADVDRTQSYTLTASTPYVDLAYPLFGDASDLKVYLDDAEITAWSLVSISGGDVSTLPRPLTDGRILFTTPITSGDLEIVYRWRPRQTNLSEASGIKRPLLLHVASEDGFVPKEAQAAMHQGLDSNSRVTLHDYPGRDHAFARTGGEHYDKQDADLANKRTLDFFAANLR